MTKIDIYSGFLGAGKTTLIKKMIQEAYKGQKLVLIENEFGEIGIDGGFLQDAGINITEMNSGCICCSLVGDFGKALTQVIEQYNPDRIVIEPSGVGKLSDVIAAVEKVTNDDVTLGYTVAVCDAGKVKVYMKNFGEFYNNQIETASTIILSRTDGISQEKLNLAVEILRGMNDHATIVTTPWSQLSGLQLLTALETKVYMSQLKDSFDATMSNAELQALMLVVAERKKVESLGIKIKELESIGQVTSDTEVDMETEIVAPDTIYINNPIIGTFDWNDGWVRVTGELTPELISAKINITDTITIVAHRKARKWLFFRCTGKITHYDAYSANPHTTISDIRYIELTE